MSSSFEHVSVRAIKVLARLAARKAITEELRAQGVRTSLVRPSIINERASVYLDEHPELMALAEERARALKLFEPKPRRPKVRFLEK
jgi:hypothetical protein